MRHRGSDASKLGSALRGYLVKRPSGPAELAAKLKAQRPLPQAVSDHNSHFLQDKTEQPQQLSVREMSPCQRAS